MPTYSYACKDCGHAFDIQQAFSDDALTVCPECGGPLRKVFSAVGVVFKGSGFYRTDSRGSGSSSGSTSSGSSGGGSAGSSGSSGPSGGGESTASGSGSAGGSSSGSGSSSSTSPSAAGSPSTGKA